MAGRVVALLSAVAVAALAACGGSDAPGASGQVRGEVTVFAATSLSDAFGEVADAFEQRYPGTEVRFNFAGSPTLRLQIDLGARADVFASADRVQMQVAGEAGLVLAPEVFATNSLVIIAPASNPAGLATPFDLAKPGLRLVLAAPEVPAGAYAREMLAALDLASPGLAERALRNVVSNEGNVKQVAAKVELGEADAGVVYQSDVTASLAGKVKVIEVPPQYNVAAEYLIATTLDARNAAGARAFVDFVLSAQGRAILEKHGFVRL